MELTAANLEWLRNYIRTEIAGPESARTRETEKGVAHWVSSAHAYRVRWKNASGAWEGKNFTTPRLPADTFDERCEAMKRAAEEHYVANHHP